MRENQQVIQNLSEILSCELTAKNMYFLHHRMQENKGYQQLASHARQCSLQAMQHCYQVMERIMFIGDAPLPNLSDEIRVSQLCEEQLSYQYKREINFSGLLRETFAVCIEHQDSATHELLNKILKVNTKQIDWLETQFRRINDLGLQDYLHEQLEISSRRAGAPV